MIDYLAEFFYSAIFWGSIVTALLWWLRRKIENRFGRAAIWVLFGWFALHTVIAWYGFLIPPSGRLIDADSGEPIGKSRVVSAWISYPTSPWSAGCSGRQAHLTDDNGQFAFRFAPYPTLISGSLMRGLLMSPPGRVPEGKGDWSFKPLSGTTLIHRFKPGHRVTGNSVGTICETAVDSQENHALLPGEAHPFEVMYREACVERQPSTLTDAYLREMMRLRSILQDSVWNWPPPDSPPTNIQQQQRKYLGLEGRCVEGSGVCASAIEPGLRDEFCVYFTSLRSIGGVAP